MRRSKIIFSPLISESLMARQICLPESWLVGPAVSIARVSALSAKSGFDGLRLKLRPWISLPSMD